MTTEVRHSDDMLNVTFWPKPDGLAEEWVVTYEGISARVNLVDNDADLWQVIYDSDIEQAHIVIGRFKTLATALGEAVLYLTE